MSKLQQAHTGYSLAPRCKSYAKPSSPAGGMRIMDYYRLNQIAMAVLGALLLFFGTRTIVNIAFQEHKPEVAEQKPEEKKPAGGGEAQLATLLASAKPEHGDFRLMLL